MEVSIIQLSQFWKLKMNHTVLQSCWSFRMFQMIQNFSSNSTFYFFGGEPQKTRHRENQGGLQQWLLPLLLYWQPCLDGNGMLEGKLNQVELKASNPRFNFCIFDGWRKMERNTRWWISATVTLVNHFITWQIVNQKCPHLQQIPWRKGGRNCPRMSDFMAMENPPFWMVSFSHGHGSFPPVFFWRPLSEKNGPWKQQEKQLKTMRIIPLKVWTITRSRLQHLQRGAKWFLKGFNSPSLRV